MNENATIDKIQNSFSLQAENFENHGMNFSKQEYLDYTVNSVGFRKTDVVLEVAAGTCACGRAIAPNVSEIICIDATPAMLAVGKEAAKKEEIANISFVEGLAEKLPFPDQCFDVVVTRLSFHHFLEMEPPFLEMRRVLKTGGKLVVIDMEAAAEPLRDVEDKIETMRDFSHVKNRSRAELEALFLRYSVKLVKAESTPVRVGLAPWMELTKTLVKIQGEIIKLMETELNGGAKTGFEPYWEDGQICFNQRWLFMMGVKE